MLREKSEDECDIPDVSLEAMTVFLFSLVLVELGAISFPAQCFSFVAVGECIS